MNETLWTECGGCSHPPSRSAVTFRADGTFGTDRDNVSFLTMSEEESSEDETHVYTQYAPLECDEEEVEEVSKTTWNDVEYAASVADAQLAYVAARPREDQSLPTRPHMHLDASPRTFALAHSMLDQDYRTCLRMSSKPATIILAIDVGSSSVRAIAFELDKGRLREFASAKMVSPSFDSNGSIDPIPLADAVEKAVIACVTNTKKRATDCHRAFDVVGIGFDCFVANWLGVGPDGKPATTLFTYADRHDGSARAAETLRAILRDEKSTDETYRRTGVPVHASYVPVTMKRLIDEDNETLDRVTSWQTFSSWLVGTWCGLFTKGIVPPVTFSEASWTGLLNVRSLRWDEKTIRRLDKATSGRMPPLVDFDASACGDKRFRVPSTTAFGKRCPELIDVPIFLAIGDGAAANVGSMCTDKTRIAVTVGTSAACRVVIPSDDVASTSIPKGLWCYRLDRKRLLLGGALTDGGSINAWLLDVLRFASTSSSASSERQLRLSEGASTIDADSHGLTVLPFLRGERAPGWHDDASMTISGIRAHTTSDDIARACIEAVAIRLGSVIHLVLGAMRPHDVDSDKRDVEIHGSGSVLTTSSLWCQILADVLGRTLHVSSVEEATCRGVAMLVAEALDDSYDLASTTVNVSRRSYAPNMKNHERYVCARARLEGLYSQIFGVPRGDIKRVVGSKGIN